MYYIKKFWHPDAKKSSEIVMDVETLEEAQEICSMPSSSRTTGPTTEQYFLGYERA